MRRLAMIALVASAARLSAQETVVVDAATVIGPALQRGSGFLQGYSDATTVHDSLLLPIKCRFHRSGRNQIVACYERNRAMGCGMEVILNSTWNKSVLPGQGGNWEAWEDHVAAVVSDLKTRGMTEAMSFSIWDNPDRDNGFWPSDEHYFEAWCRAQRKVREIMPSALMAGASSTWGPNTDWWSAHEGDDTWYIRQFLDYAIAQGCTPDIVSRHDHYNDGAHIESDEARLRQYYASKGIAPIPFEQDDLGARFSGGPEQFRPGHYIALFASIERVKVLRTCKCCWDSDCSTNNLNGLLTKDTRRKRSLWWAYRAYADVTGCILAVTKGTSTDAVAGWDTTDNIMRIVLGRNAATTGNVTVGIRNLATNGAQATITGRAIPCSNADVAPAPVQTLSTNAVVSGGNLTFDITDLGAYDAYAIEISGLGWPVAAAEGEDRRTPAIRQPRNITAGPMFDLRGKRIGQGPRIRLSSVGVVVMQAYPPRAAFVLRGIR